MKFAEVVDFMNLRMRLTWAGVKRDTHAWEVITRMMQTL
jgi:hypothetical protein